MSVADSGGRQEGDGYRQRGLANRAAACRQRHVFVPPAGRKQCLAEHHHLHRAFPHSATAAMKSPRKGKQKDRAPWADLQPDALSHVAQLLPIRDRCRWFNELGG